MVQRSLDEIPSITYSLAFHLISSTEGKSFIHSTAISLIIISSLLTYLKNKLLDLRNRSITRFLEKKSFFFFPKYGLKQCWKRVQSTKFLFSSPSLLLIELRSYHSGYSLKTELKRNYTHTHSVYFLKQDGGRGNPNCLLVSCFVSRPFMLNAFLSCNYQNTPSTRCGGINSIGSDIS